MTKLVPLLVFIFLSANLYAQQPRLVLPVGHTAPVKRADYSTDGKLVLSSGMGTQVFVWEAETGRLLNVFEMPGATAVRAIFSPDNQYVGAVSTGVENNVVVWQLATGKQLLTSTAGSLDDVLFPVRDMVVISNADSVTVHHLSRRTAFTRKKMHGTPVFIANDLLSLFKHQDHSLQVERWNIQTQKSAGTVEMEYSAWVRTAITESRYSPFRFSNTGKYILLDHGAGNNDSIHLFSTTSGKHLHAVPVHRWVGAGAMFSKTDKFFTYPIGENSHILVIDLERNTHTPVEIYPSGEQVITDSFLYVVNNSRGTIKDTGLVSLTQITAVNLYTKEKDLLYYLYGQIDNITMSGDYIIANYIPINLALASAEYVSRNPSRVLVFDLGKQSAAFDYNKKTRTEWKPARRNGDQFKDTLNEVEKIWMYGFNTVAVAAALPGIFTDPGARLIHNDKILVLRDTSFAVEQYEIPRSKLLTRMQGKNARPAMLSFIDTTHLFTGTRLVRLRNAATLTELPGVFIEWNEEKQHVKLRLPDSSVAVYDIHGQLKAHAPGMPIASGLSDDWDYLFAAVKDSVRVAGIHTAQQYMIPGEFALADEGGKYLVTTKGSHAKAVSTGWNYNDPEKDTATAASDAVLYIWQLPTGKLLKQLPAEYVEVLLDTAANVEYLVAEKEIRKGEDYLERTWIYNFKTGDTLEIPGSFESARDDNRYITIKEEGKHHRYELPRGRKLAEDEEEVEEVATPSTKPLPAFDSLRRVWYSHDRNYQLSFKNSNTAVVHETGGAALVEFPLNFNELPMKAFKFSVDPARRYLFYSALTDHGIVNIKTRKITALQDPIPNEILIQNYFTKNGRLITITERPSMYFVDLVLTAWNVTTGRRILTVEAEPYTRNFLFATSEDDRLATVYKEGMLHLYNLETGKLLYKYLPVAGEGGLALDAGNHYDGSEAARQMLYFSCGTELVSLSQVKDQLWVPNLAERIMKGETINAASLSDLEICGLTPLIENKKQDNAYQYTITPRKGGLGETVLYVNGIEVKRYKATELAKTGASFQLNISNSSLEQYFINGEENEVTVKAYTQQNNISSRGLTLKKSPSSKDTTPPNLYAVMVGVSDYKGEELDLKYAAKDAQDLSNAVAAAARKLLNRDGKERVFMYNITTGDKRMKFPEKQAIRDVFTDIGKQATARDILLVFFAGHGVMEGEKKLFYFLTAEASKNGDVQATGISIAELNEWMKPQHIKAQKRILIFDACNSGQAINDLVTIGNKEDKYVAARNDDESNRIKAVEKLNERSGMFILSASATNQSAYELGMYAQGVLTYALLKAIKEDPSILEDGKLLNVDKWFATAERTVTDIISQTGNRQQPQKFGTGGFNIGEVDTDVIAGIDLPRAKPLFTASNFFNPAAGDDDLELTKEVNNHMGYIAARGAESKITYIMASNDPAAYTLTGTYETAGAGLKVKVNIKQNKEIKYRFELNTANKDLTAAAAEILKQVEEWVQKR